MGSKIVRSRVDINKQEFLGPESDQMRQTLNKVYDELDGDDQAKLEILKKVHTDSKELQKQLDDAGVNWPPQPDKVSEFFLILTDAQVKAIYDGIRQLDE